MEDAARLRRAVLGAELHGRHLDLNEAAVAPSQARHADGGAGSLPLGHGDVPAGVLLVDEPVPPEGTDLFGGHVDHGAGGRVGRSDAAVLGAEEHTFGTAREEDPIAGKADRVYVLSHHAVSFL